MDPRQELVDYLTRQLVGPAGGDDEVLDAPPDRQMEAHNAALLTGCWGERLPAPTPLRSGAALSRVPAQRRADAKPPVPADLVAAVRDRTRTTGRYGRRFGGGRPANDPADLPQRCEIAVRLALSYLVAPIGEGVAGLVRAAVGDGFSATSRRAADR